MSHMAQQVLQQENNKMAASPNNNNNNIKKETSDGETPQQTPSKHALYGNSLCKWPGCDLQCCDILDFLK